jgi:Domain of unknown function (DUF4338)
MECLLRYRGKDITAQEVEFIKNFIAQNPAQSRRALSTQLCQVWNWAQANGGLRSMVCRGMMLALHRAGHIQLPPVRHQPPNPLAQRRQPAPLTRAAWEPIQAAVRELGPLEIRQVRRTPEEQLFGSLIQAHHYLAYTQPVGEHLKHLVYARGTPIACLAWSSAPRHLGPRDRFIGWTAQERRVGIHLLAYNTRFLLLPWAKVPGLASHVLSQAARVVSEDWQRLYHHPVYLLETFIDPQRFGGVSYQAANWRLLGWTTGRGKDAPTRQSNRPLKQLWVLPLVQDFRAKLRQGHG